jgi:class 3 adenylate cyclase
MDVEAMNALLLELHPEPDNSHETLSYYIQGGLLFFKGEYLDAIAEFEKAKKGFSDAGDEEGVLLSSGNIAICNLHSSRYAQGYQILNQVLELATKLGDQRRIAWCNLQMGGTFSYIRDHERALEYLYRAVDISRGLDDGLGVVSGLYSISVSLSFLGRYKEAISVSIESLEHPSAKVNLAQWIHLKIHLAYLYEQSGRVEEVDKILSEIDDSQISEFRWSVNVKMLRAMQDFRRGNIDAALRASQAALEQTQEAKVPDLEVTIREIMRDQARKMEDFEAYVSHNDAIQKINHEIRGAETSRRMAFYEVEQTMAAERAAAEKQKALLYGALPKEVAERMLRGEDVSGDRYEVASVLFLDIAEFTSASSSMDPQSTTKLLASIFSRFDEICAQYGVTKIKTIGDSYMAVSFPGVSNNPNADLGMSSELRASCVASEMLASDFAWPDGSPVQFRIGIHAGPVVAGVIGTQRLQYDVWGDTVNIASRMESTGEPGRIQISSDFAERIKDKGNWILDKHMQEVKGKGMMESYWLARKKSAV